MTEETLAKLKEDMAVMQSQAAMNATRSSEDRTEIRKKIDENQQTLGRIEIGLSGAISQQGRNTATLQDHSLRLKTVEGTISFIRGAMWIVGGLLGALMGAGGWLLHALFGK